MKIEKTLSFVLFIDRLRTDSDENYLSGLKIISIINIVTDFFVIFAFFLHCSVLLKKYKNITLKKTLI